MPPLMSVLCEGVYIRFGFSSNIVETGFVPPVTGYSNKCAGNVIQSFFLDVYVRFSLK